MRKAIRACILQRWRVFELFMMVGFACIFGTACELDETEIPNGPRIHVVSPSLQDRGALPPFVLWEVVVENLDSESVVHVRIGEETAAFDGTTWWGIGEYPPGQHTVWVDAETTAGRLEERVTIVVLRPEQADAFVPVLDPDPLSAGMRTPVTCERRYGGTAVPEPDVLVLWEIYATEDGKTGIGDALESGAMIAGEETQMLTRQGLFHARCVAPDRVSEIITAPVDPGPARDTFISLSLPPGEFAATAGETMPFRCSGIDAWGNESTHSLVLSSWPAGAVQDAGDGHLQFRRAGDVVVGCYGSTAATPYTETIRVSPDVNGPWMLTTDHLLPPGPSFAEREFHMPMGRVADQWGNAFPAQTEYPWERTQVT